MKNLSTGKGYGQKIHFLKSLIMKTESVLKTDCAETWGGKIHVHNDDTGSLSTLSISGVFGPRDTQTVKDNVFSGEILGKQLALLHQNSNDSFGLGEDNWIGLSPQKNHWNKNWVSFFKEKRLLPQFMWAFEHGYRSSLEAEAERLMEALPLFFDQYKPQPSLLHGDLWSGNWGTINNTTPVVFDPAIYYGDREADLAMTKLFGGFPQVFYDAYNYQWALDYGFKVRQNLYNLYHLLNHLTLFGEVYLRQTIDVFEQLLSEI